VYGTAVTLENRFLFVTGSRTLVFVSRRYDRPTLATAGSWFLFLLVHNILAIHYPKYENILLKYVADRDI